MTLEANFNLRVHAVKDRRDNADAKKHTKSLRSQRQAQQHGYKKKHYESAYHLLSVFPSRLAALLEHHNEGVPILFDIGSAEHMPQS